MAPTSIDEYLSERKAGDVVSGRIVEVVGDSMVAELGEGICARGKILRRGNQENLREPVGAAKADLQSLSSMLAARWKSGVVPESSNPEEIRAGQVRRFRITQIDPAAKKIEVELA
jgi:small subunit ribosomal protein S1